MDVERQRFWRAGVLRQNAFQYQTCAKGNHRRRAETGDHPLAAGLRSSSIQTGIAFDARGFWLHRQRHRMALLSGIERYFAHRARMRKGNKQKVRKDESMRSSLRAGKNGTG